LVILIFVSTPSCSPEERRSEWCNVNLNVSVPSGISTQTLCAFFYDHASGKLSGKVFMNDYSQSRSDDKTFSMPIKLGRGKYDIVAYNFDMPDTFIRGEECFGTLEAYTKEVNESVYSAFGRQVVGQETDTTVVYTPDPMAVAAVQGVDLKEGSEISIAASIVTREDPLSIQADGLAYARSRSCIAGGMAGSMFIGTLKAGTERCIWFPLEADGTLKADILSFGPVCDKHDLTVSITTSEATWLYSALADAGFMTSGCIIIPKPSVPDTDPDDQGGFKPQIGEWRDYSVVVPL